MKKMGKILTVALAASAAITLAACEDGSKEEVKPDITDPEVKPELDKQLNINVKIKEVNVTDTFDVNVTTKDLTGDLTITADNENLSWTNNNGVVTFTANTAGLSIVTFKQDGLTQTLRVVTNEENEVYKLFDADGNEIPTEGDLTFQQVLSKIMTEEIKAWGTHVRNSAGEKVFQVNTGWNSALMFFDANGASDALFSDELKADSGKYLSEGHTTWWANYDEQLEIYSQNHTSVFSKDDNRFVTRPTEFNLAFADGASGFNTDPNGIWNGWRASAYRAGMSVAQYAGWADGMVDGKALDQFIFTYDLTQGVMKPAQNGSSTTRADIWVGSSNAGVCADMLMGVTFDAGSAETNKDLADGATRGWYVFTETMNGVATTEQGTRTLSEESVGTATWDKTNGVWIHDFKITIDQTFTTDDEGNFVRTITANVGDDEAALEFNDGKEVDTTQYRFTYGVNYTPSGTGFVDLDNGGYWIGVIQDDVKGYSEGTAIRNYDFLAGRTVNAGNQTGLYGCDVVSARLNGRKTEFNFMY